MDGLTESFRRAVFEVLGLDPDSELPVLERLALLRAEVKAVESDGTKLDVQPEDEKADGHQAVPVRVGVPGLVAVAKAGARTILAWEGGNPARAFVAALWEMGSTAAKLVFNSDLTVIGGEAGADEVMTKKDMLTFLKAWESAGAGGSDGGALMRTNTLLALDALGGSWSRAGATLLALGSSKLKAQR